MPGSVTHCRLRPRRQDVTNGVRSAQFTFASFLSRDTTYDLIGNIWRMIHPGVPTSAALPDAANNDSDEDASVDEDGSAATEPKEKRSKRSKIKSHLRKRGDSNARDRGVNGDSPSTKGDSTGGSKNKSGGGGGGGGGGVGKADASKAAHAVTKDSCKTLTNLKENCMDTIFPSTPEKIYNLMFTSGFMKEFWADNQKLTGETYPHTSRRPTCAVRLTRY